jgi:hypothetical protein
MFCNNCHSNIPENVFILHERRCINYCKYCIECQSVIPIIDWEKHCDTYHKVMVCEDCGCSYNSSVDHKNECESRSINCKWCNCPYTTIELIKHEEQCGNCTFICENCGDRIRNNQRENHAMNCIKNSIIKPKPENQYGSRLDPCQNCGEWVVLTEHSCQKYDCPWCIFITSSQIIMEEHISMHPEYYS